VSRSKRLNEVAYATQVAGRPTVETKLPRAQKLYPTNRAASLAVNSHKMDRALAFDVANRLTDRVFQRYRQQRVNVSGVKCPSSTRLPLLCLGQVSEYWTEVSLQIAVQRLPAEFWNETDVIFASRLM
jgi:hypothetical protein